MMLPYSIKTYPIIQTAREVSAPSATEWPAGKPHSSGFLASARNQLYLHVPFCPFLCSFCPLYKVETPRSTNAAKKLMFLDALHREISLYGARPGIRETVFHAVYFGGGTPTELSPDQLTGVLRALRKQFTIAEDAEVTIEGVAGQMLEPGYLDKCFEAGFNRVSFGAQSLDPEVRRLVGRGDDVDTYPKLIQQVRQRYPQAMINLEIMAGQPGQSIESLASDIETLISWRPDSMDILYYVMMPGTTLERSIRGNRRPSPAFGDSLLSMRRHINQRLPGAGYRQVTAEAFAKDDRDLFAETSYGGGANDGVNTVLALGPSGFGLIQGCAYQNVCDLEGYVSALKAQCFPVSRLSRMTRRTSRIRGIMMSLMRLQVPRHLVDDHWWYRRIVRRWRRQGWIEPASRMYALTECGKLWYNHMQMDILPMYDMAWALRMFGSIPQQLDMMARDSDELRPFEQALISQLKSHGQLMFGLYRLFLLLHRMPFVDRRPIGFTGPIALLEAE